MTKAELIEEVAKGTGQNKAEAERNLDAIVATIGSALERGERLDLRGFGIFSVRETKARQGRNPRSGETIQIPAKRVAVFKPSKDLGEKVNASAKSNESEISNPS